MRRVLISVVLLSVLAFVPMGNAAVLADSQTGFSGTQGGNGWTYELENNGVYSQMTYDSGASEWSKTDAYSGQAFTLKINATSQMHCKIGGGTAQGVASRRIWTTASAVTDVAVTGAWNVPSDMSARVQIYKIVGGTLTHVADLVNGSGSGTYSKAIGALAAGDSVLTRLGPWTITANLGEQYVPFSMNVTGIPEPATIALLSLGGLLLRRKR